MLLEFRTPAGYYIVVNEADFSCGVFRGEVGNITADVLRSTGLHVAGVAFLGRDVRPTIDPEGFVLLPVRSGSLWIPYAVDDGAGHSSEKKGIQLSVKVATDQFPIFLKHFPDARSFLHDLGDHEKKTFRVVMMGAGVPRIDAMGVRVALSGAKIFQSRVAPDSTVRNDPSKLRAADLVEQPGMDFVGRNPVYMARVLLRRLDFSGMERLPIDFDLNAQDVEFIRAFLDVMLRNENGSEELNRHHERILELGRFFSLVDLVVQRNQPGLEQALSTRLPENITLKLLPFLQKQRQKAASKEEEIALWELEYRITGRSGG